MQDLLNYKGKKCVVTGAASGMGEATAKLLIGQGAEVYALDIKETSVSVKEFINVNLGNRDSIDQAVSKLPNSIDHIFNCAGVAGKVYSGGTFSDLDVVTINFIGSKYLIESLIPRLSEGSSVAIISSTAAMNWVKNIDNLRGFIETNGFAESQEWFIQHQDKLIENDFSSYTISKESLIIWMKHLAYEISDKKIRVNSVSPGSTETPMTKDFKRVGLGGTHVSKVGTSATSVDQAKALLFLNSDLASYVSGQDLQVDYGFTVKAVYGLD